MRERLVASVPEFLRSGIRGDTDAEVLFHVFLSFLHDAGRLNDGQVEASLVARGAALEPRGGRRDDRRGGLAAPPS